MFGDTEAIVDRRIPGSGKASGPPAQLVGGNACRGFRRFGRVLRINNKIAPLVKRLGFAALGNEGLVLQTLGHDHMGHGVDESHIASRSDLEVLLVVGTVGSVRRIEQVDLPGIGHDQLGALTQAAAQAGGKHRMAVSWVSANHQGQIGVLDGVEILSAGRLTQGLLQSVSGGRVANPRAGVDIVIGKRSAHQLLDQESFLVGTAGRRNGRDGLYAVVLL